MAQAMTYSLARLVGIAVNDPKKMPKFDKVFPDRHPKPAQSDGDILSAMKRWTDVIEAARKQQSKGTAE